MHNVIGVYVQTNPLLPSRNVAKADKESLYLDFSLHYGNDVASNTTYRIVRDYFVFQGVPSALKLTVRHVDHDLVTKLYSGEEVQPEPFCFPGALLVLI